MSLTELATEQNDILGRARHAYMRMPREHWLLTKDMFLEDLVSIIMRHRTATDGPVAGRMLHARMNDARDQALVLLNRKESEWDIHES